MANAPRSKQAFRRSKTQATRDNATYPHFDEGRRTFLRHFGLLLAGGAAGAALVGCGDERAAPLDTQPHYADSGAAPMPLDAATRHDAGVGTDGQ